MKAVAMKGRDGWQSENWIPLEGETINEGDRFLKLMTYKSDRAGLVTSATVCAKTDVGYCHAMFSDYSKRVMQSKTRETEKSVEVQHQAALNDLEFILADARSHYAKEVAHA